MVLLYAWLYKSKISLSKQEEKQGSPWSVEESSKWVSCENWVCLLKHVITVYTLLTAELLLLGQDRKCGFPFFHFRDAMLFSISILLFEPFRLWANKN